ncbi:mitochondrial enolase superfamily member 1 [Vidua chalybeata]|uniref:mitochondrial enolase superfamily member 1 n=1 Tax=Vidua chalybeata TaxID=81927 RepID=UPI0023A8C11B|nr:mitochondrial enolase superfamily member 1 [Vidua chalybeata]
MEYRYITGVLPEEEAYEQKMLKYGHLTYSGSYSCLGYSDQQLKQFEPSLDIDIVIATLNAECKAKWEIKEAIQWVTEPAGFKASCIKEPTFPDEDIHIQMGHATVSKLGVLGIGAATRERCHNRVIFKHLLQAKALSCLQVDSCRLGSVNESLSVLLMAKNVAVISSMDIGLCQLVQHLIVFDYIQVSERLENRYKLHFNCYW